MDVYDAYKKSKDAKIKAEIEKKMLEALKKGDEEAYFEEETREIAGWKFIEGHLIEEENAYFTKAIPKEGPFCLTCWKVEHQLNKVKRTDRKGEYACVICDIRKK